MKETITVPVTATFYIIDGEAVKVSAEYEEIQTEEIVKLLLRGFPEVKAD